INPDQQRDRLAEGLDIIMRLINGEVVTARSEWFDLREARLQLKPYTRPRPHMAVASAITPSGGKLAGKHGLGMLCVAASSPAGAVARLKLFWQKTGGFGCMLMLAHDWANFEATKKSYEMFMRYVLPKFAGRNEAREASLSWIRSHREEFSSAGKAAAMKVVN